MGLLRESQVYRGDKGGWTRFMCLRFGVESANQGPWGGRWRDASLADEPRNLGVLVCNVRCTVNIAIILKIV